MTARRRVAITGIGLVTPVGNDAPSTWAGLIEGRSGLGVITNFDASGFSSRIGAEVKNFPNDAGTPDRKLAKFASRTHRFALAAAEEALTDAGIRPNDANSHRWGLSVGAGMMGLAFEELATVHAHCAASGEFNPDGLIKVAPLLHWSSKDLYTYCEAHGLPNNFDYVDPTKGEDNRECGLHLAH